MISSFERIEQKYIIRNDQKERLVNLLLSYMSYDKFCKNGGTYHVRNIYFDTSDNSLIRKSIEKPVYKEKLRARKYDNMDKVVFLEIKKKNKGVVGKRRILISEDDLKSFVYFKQKPQTNGFTDTQIANELEFFLKYHDVKENVFLSYDRLGFFSKEDMDFRITFDTNIYSSRDNFDWEQKTDSNFLLDDNHSLMEIKLSKGYPFWLVDFLSAEKIYPCSFSKYGQEFKNYIKENNNYVQ